MWRRLPVWLRAILVGFVVSGVPTITWGVLATINVRLTPRLPWSVAAMAVLLWAYWRFLRSVRNDHLRVAPLTPRVWRMALLGGGSAIAALWASFAALRGMLHMTPPANDLNQLPIWTVFSAIVMGSAVAGVAEEAGFRGYMQVPLERAYGAGIAITVTSLLFTLVHLTHGAAVLPLLPFYFVAAVAYGLLAFLTGSILPGMILHFAGDLLTFTLRYLGARAGGAGAASTGTISPAFAILSVAFAVAAVLIYRMLAREGRAAPSISTMASA